MEKCLYCYKPLKPGQTDFHPACARKLFGKKEAPVLPYTRAEIADLAKQVIRAQTTLTGVQAKLSLDINPGGRNEPSRFTIVGLWGRFILKPQTEVYRSLPELEDLTMHMAEAAKIAVVPHSLIRFADGELPELLNAIELQNNGKPLIVEVAQHIGDNVVREGEVINGQSDDARVQGVRRFIEMMGDNPRLTATALQTVGVKGWDGFTLAIVNG